jgi:hypothetical protein
MACIDEHGGDALSARSRARFQPSETLVFERKQSSRRTWYVEAV